MQSGTLCVWSGKMRWQFFLTSEYTYGSRYKMKRKKWKETNMPIGQFVVWVRSLVILPIECFLICFLLAVLLSFFPSPLWSRHRIPYFHTLLLIVYSFICTFMPPHHAPLPMSTISSVESNKFHKGEPKCRAIGQGGDQELPKDRGCGK
jgi:hypothetical protein